MSVEAVNRLILEPMQRVFLPPRNMSEEDIQAALRPYCDVLSAFRDEDLEKGWAAVLGAHTTRAWPVPGVIAAACRHARGDRTAPQSRYSDNANSLWSAWLDARKSDKALRAADAGVAWSFRATIFGGVPLSQISIDRLIQDSHRAAATAKRIQDGQSHFWQGRDIGAFDPSLASVAIALYRSLMDKEDITAAEIRRAHSFGGSDPGSAAVRDEEPTPIAANRASEEDVQGLLPV